MSKDKPSLLSVAVALTLIAEKASHQAARTIEKDTKTSLLEIRAHCVTALEIITELRK
jgi:hypothetical protein